MEMVTIESLSSLSVLSSDVMDQTAVELPGDVATVGWLLMTAVWIAAFADVWYCKSTAIR